MRKFIVIPLTLAPLAALVLTAFVLASAGSAKVTLPYAGSAQQSSKWTFGTGDLVDSSPTMEVDGVKKEDYWKVVDQCYLCDLCYMTKCPYVPPHPWNLDFPHTMLRAKAIKFKQGGVAAGEQFLASTDKHGQFAGIPVVVQTANALNKTKPMRRALDKTLHVHPDAWLPALATPQTGAFGR